MSLDLIQGLRDRLMREVENEQRRVLDDGLQIRIGNHILYRVVAELRMVSRLLGELDLLFEYPHANLFLEDIGKFVGVFSGDLCDS
ncbi:hypothetical protein EYZ11_001069 [Aspergillus tanneri]|uniref:Uncharacterized protein n=1 Tax=Aspergillus tanneri TaxID=1220188 RepID=A0A4S3JVI1_9EURO|nr:hypothetical protein EYZ11_001069 [Aspergillus tanneri]